jgi:hypothetical protein
MANISSTVVEQSTHNLKFKGLNLAATKNGGENSKRELFE